MAREKTIQICSLNFAANPHPDGVYVTLLRKASRFLVSARGSDYAKITEPRKSETQPYYIGRILIWTEIDVDGPWLDLEKEEILHKSLKDTINIPNTAKPNYRVFSYAFDNSRHQFFFESKNEFGESLGPTTAKRIFARLFSQELLGLDSPEVEVTITPEEGAVDRILTLPGLRSLHMRVTLPNPDLASPAARRRVFKRLNDANARQLDEHFVKAAGAPALVATPEIRETAEVAADNGFVRGEGRAADGKKISAATDDFPQRIYVGLDQGRNFLARLIAALRPVRRA